MTVSDLKMHAAILQRAIERAKATRHRRELPDREGDVRELQGAQSRDAGSRMPEV